MTAELSIMIRAQDSASQVLKQVAVQMAQVGNVTTVTAKQIRQATRDMSAALEPIVKMMAQDMTQRWITGFARLIDAGGKVKTFFRELGGGIREGLAQAERGFEESERKANKASEGFGGLGRSIILLNQAWELFNKVLGVVKSTWDNTVGALIDDAVKIDELRKRLQLTVSQVQDLQVISEASGVSVTSLASAIQTLSRNLGQAGNTASIQFKVLHDGLKFTVDEIKALGDMSPLERFQTILKRFDEFAPSAERDAQMAKLFGRSIQDLNLLLANWDDAEQALARDRERGLRLNDEQIAGAKKISDLWTELIRVLGQMRDQIAAQPTLLKAVSEGLEQITDSAVITFRELLKIFGPQLSQLIEDASAKMREFSAYLKTPEGAQATATAVNNLATSVTNVYEQLKRVIDLGANPVGLVVLSALLGGRIAGLPGAAIASIAGVALAGVNLASAIHDAREGAQKAIDEADKTLEGGYSRAQPGTAPSVPGASFASEEDLDRIKRYNTELGNTKKTLGEVVGVTKEHKDVIAEANQQYSEAYDTLTRYWQKQKEGVETTKDVEYALKQLHEAETALNQAAEKGDVQSQKRLFFVRSQIEIFEEYKDQVKAVADEHKKLDSAQEKYSEGLEKLQGKIVGAGNAIEEYRQKVLAAAKAGQDWNRLTQEQQETLKAAAAEGFQAEGIQKANEVLKTLTDSLQQDKAKVDALAPAYEKLTAALVSLRAAAEGGNEVAKAQVDGFEAQFAQIAKATKVQEDHRNELEKTKGAYFDLFDAIGKGMEQVISGLVSGTLKAGDAFKSLKTSIVGALISAFTEGIKEKLKFDDTFKVNIVGLGKELVGILGGLLGGGGGGGQGGTGVLGTLFQGALSYAGLPSGGTTAAAAGVPTGGTAAAGGSGLLAALGGAGGTAGLLLAAGTYAGATGNKGYGALLQGASGLGYGAQALFASQYGPAVSGYLAQNAPQLFNVAQLFGATTAPAAAAGGAEAAVGGIGSSVGFSPVAAEAGAPAAQVGSTIGTVAGALGVVTGLAAAGLGIYSAIKAETSYGKAQGAISAAAGVSAAVAAGAAVGLFGAAAAASVVPIVGWIVAAVLIIVAALMMAFQPGPDYRGAFKDAFAKLLDKTLEAPGVFEGRSNVILGKKKREARQEEFEKLTTPQKVLLEVGGRGAMRAVREIFGSVGYEDALNIMRGILHEGVGQLLVAGRDIDKIITKLITSLQTFGQAITTLNVVVFDKDTNKLKGSVEDYATEVAFLVHAFSSEFPKTIDALAVATEVVTKYGIATVVRLKRQALQDVARIAVETGVLVTGTPMPGFLAGETDADRAKIKTLSQSKGKAKRQAAAEGAESAVDEMISGFERSMKALTVAGEGGAPLRQAVANVNVAYAGIESLTHVGAKAFAEEFPKAIDVAVQAIKGWGDTMLNMIDQLRTLKKQMQEAARAFAEEQDSLRKGQYIWDARDTGRQRALHGTDLTKLPTDVENMTLKSAREFAERVAAQTAEIPIIPSAETKLAYDALLNSARQTLGLADSFSAKVTALQDIMNLLRQQAQAAIQDVNDRLDQEVSVIQGYIDTLNDQIDAEKELIDANNDRIEALGKEIDDLDTMINAVSGLAGMVDTLKDAMNQTKLAGVSQGVGQVQELQRQTADAMGEFGKAQEKFNKAYADFQNATDDNRITLTADLQTAAAERQAAAQKALGLSQNLLQAAGSVFSLGSGEYLSIQNQVLSYQKSLLEAAKAAKEEEDRLRKIELTKQEDRDQLQRDNEEHQKRIQAASEQIAAFNKQIQIKQEAAARAIAQINADLADALQALSPALYDAMSGMQKEIHDALLAQGLTEDEITKAMADPVFAQLLISRLQLAKLEELRQTTVAVVNAILLGNLSKKERDKITGADLTAPIPGLAAGGEFTVTRPTLFVAGEKYAQERIRVTPLGQENGNGGPINFHVTINVQGGGAMDGQRFARTAADSLEAEMRLRLPRILEKKIA